MKFDYEISRQEIQELSSSDAIAAFFSKLGYRTDSRTAQAPANLGITANGTLRPIKKTELIADQEGLLQVYLFELTSVTVSHTRSLCRAFRNRAGNFLLILTSDYERLDFVLLEKYIPSSSKSGKTISLSQVNVRPRTLTVNRKKPETVHLRVLRRFTYTESDQFAQYDKLLCAYAIADWSEEYFNNRALFSDHCLLERLRERPEWQEDPKPTYQALRELYVSASSRFANKPETDVRKELYEPAFKKLGFDFKVGKKSNSSMHEPDYYLLQKGKKKTTGVCLTYTWGRSLDSKDDQRDQETSEENPGAVVVSLLERGLAPWAIVTNGRIWRLYSQKTHSRATNYYEIDLEEILAQGGPLANDPAEAFRFFWLLFRCEAFIAKAIQRDGKEQQLCFLDELLSDSETYAKELGDRLKDRVFERVFPQLSEGFIKYIRARDGKQADLSQERLDQVFTGTLMFLYRLLFLLYAESRGLLPVKEVRGFFEVSIEKIKRETADVVGRIEDEVEKGLKKHFKDNEYALYDRLLRLFEVIDRGDSDLNVPVYNGGLFITHPDEDDLTDDAHNARFLHGNKIPDRFLARAVDLLARDIDTKRQDLVFIDYKSLGVRQLGSIYEGLLEFKLRVAPEKMAIVKGKKTEEVVPYKEAVEKKRKILTKGRGRNAPERILAKGEVYLENDKRERKATGSYYTPDYIVDYIVDHTVGPVLQEKFEALRPILRQAQKERQEFFKKQEALKKKGIKPEPESKVNLIGQELVRNVFDIKVLDPAMGSGHFLVEAVDYITDKTIDFLNAFPWNPVTVYLNQMRETILSEMDEQGISIDRNRLTDVNLLKRHVLKRSVYGVDINPMAVELAKVSLWLDCFTLGAPLSFLDHHLRCGNSLVGTTVEEVEEAIKAKGQTSLLFAADRFAGLMRATDWMRHVGELSDVTTAQVRQSRNEYRKASDALLPFKRTLDLYTSRWFGNTPVKQITRKKSRGKERITEHRDVTVEVICSSEVDPVLRAATQDIEREVAKLTEDDQKILRTATNAAAKHRFFHWELEFPEVFYEEGQKKRRAGFDVCIGNPPYIRQEGLGDTKPFLKDVYFHVYHGMADIYIYFYAKGCKELHPAGRFGMITSNKFTRSSYGAPLRKHVADNYCLLDIVDFGELPVFDDASTFPCIVILKKADQGETCQFTQVQDLLFESLQSVIDVNGIVLPEEALCGEKWSLCSRLEVAILRKMEQCGLRLTDYLHKNKTHLRRGVVTGFNQAFVIDEETKNDLMKKDPHSTEIVQPLIVGDDVRRYRVNYKKRYLIFSHHGIQIDNYPAIKRHLSKWRSELTPKKSKDQEGLGRKPGCYKWFEIQDTVDYYSDFEKKKIVYPEIAKEPRFHLDQKGLYPLKTIFCIPSCDWFLLAILNSTAAFWYLSQVCTVLGDAKNRGRLTMQAIYLERLPIPEATITEEEALARLSKNRTELEENIPPHNSRRKKKQGIPAVTIALDKEIDSIVYDLYGLTQEEIAVIEGRAE